MKKKNRFLIAFGMTIIATVLLISCKAPVKKTTEPNGKFLAVYIDKKGQKRVGEVLRVQNDKIKIDSATGKKEIITETLYGYFTLVPMKDSLGNVLKAKSGTDSLLGGWQLVGKDSVNFKVENIPIDSLLKK
jgi:hypothetical protein